MPIPDRNHAPRTTTALPYFAGWKRPRFSDVVDLAVWQELAAGGVVFLEGDLNAGFTSRTEADQVVKLSVDGRESGAALLSAWANPSTRSASSWRS
ncbi:MAG: hypothetical protein H6643_15410 [Caldilineaceae bacterium]|nr:hypothetical protein [Caldilineaceae bacterium]